MRAVSVVRVFATLVLVAGAAWSAWLLWQYYFYSPWTRDGRVVANIIQQAPQVSGQIVSVHVKENQFVKTDDVLFTIQDEPYRIAVKAAEARVASTKATWQMKKSIFDRLNQLSQLATTAQEQEDARLAAAAAEADFHSAQSQLDHANLQLQWTTARARTDGWVTNINLNAGDYAIAGVQSVAIVDASSLRIEAFFEETKLFDIPLGARANVYLMAGGEPLKGTVASVARGIADVDNPRGAAGLMAVKPNYQWIRLAQRIPVRINLDTIPHDLPLVSGMTATVVIEPAEKKALVIPAPDAPNNPGRRDTKPGAASPAQ